MLITERRGRVSAKKKTLVAAPSHKNEQIQSDLLIIYFGSIIFLVGLTMTHYRFAMPAASLDMNLRQCMRTFTPTAKNSGTACFLRRRDQAS